MVGGVCLRTSIERVCFKSIFKIKDMLEQIHISNAYLTLKAALVVMLWGCVMLAVTIDLYHGIKRSKKDGEYTHSTGLKRTVSKSVNYLSFMLFMLIADMIASLATSSLLPFGFAVLPLFNIVGAMVLVYNEWVSVRENSDQKMMNRINRSGIELSKIAVDLMLAYKNNPEVLQDILKKYDDNKKIEDEKIH